MEQKYIIIGIIIIVGIVGITALVIGTSSPNYDQIIADNDCYSALKLTASDGEKMTVSQSVDIGILLVACKLNPTSTIEPTLPTTTKIEPKSDYFKTDKSSYGYGDTIKVTGIVNLPEPFKETISDELQQPYGYIFKFDVISVDYPPYQPIFCSTELQICNMGENYTEHDYSRYGSGVTHTYSEYQEHYKISQDGSFEFNVPINEKYNPRFSDLKPEEYYITVRTYIVKTNEHKIIFDNMIKECIINTAARNLYDESSFFEDCVEPSNKKRKVYVSGSSNFLFDTRVYEYVSPILENTYEKVYNNFGVREGKRTETSFQLQ